MDFHLALAASSRSVRNVDPKMCFVAIMSFIAGIFIYNAVQK